MTETKREIAVLVSHRDALGADQVCLMEETADVDDLGCTVFKPVYVPNRTRAVVLKNKFEDEGYRIQFKAGGPEYIVDNDDVLKMYPASERVIRLQVKEPEIDEEPSFKTKEAHPEWRESVCRQIHAA